jgi:signal transduction histidine kinase
LVASALSSPWLALVAVLAMVLATALLVYQLSSDIVAQSVEHRLQAVATLKASLVTHYLDDARDDLSVSVTTPALLKDIDEWRATGVNDPLARQRLVDDLGRISKLEHFVEISLRDPLTGGLLLTTTGDTETPEVRRAAVASAAAKEPVMEEFHIDTDHRTNVAMYFFGFFAKVSTPLGATLVLHAGIDPRHTLFPLIEQWPGATKTAEVLLMRRDGQSMLVLNDPSMERLSAQSHRSSATPEHFFAAALAHDATGALRGKDDSGESVLAFAVPVPATSWLLVAKLDTSEAYAELNRVALMATAIVGSMMMLGAWWWLERHGRRVQRQNLQDERAAHTRRLVELSGRVIVAQEEERRRWSSELHDRIGANLATIGLNLRAIGRAIPAPVAEDEELLSETSALLGETVASIREFCTALRPVVLDYAGLVAAIEGLAQQIRRRSATTIEFEYSEFKGRCSPEIETVLYRIVQEALLNCQKHAQAQHVVVRLTGSPEHLRLSIEDDGAGFDHSLVDSNTNSAGHGLVNMRERAEYVGARFEVRSRPGEGTRITFESI